MDGDDSVQFLEMNLTIRHTYVYYLTQRQVESFILVNFFVISMLISLAGVVGNVMNIIVFYKQGFANTMNITFFGLAVADLCSLITLLWLMVILSGALVKTGLKMSPTETQYLAAGFPHICFARITSWITVYITAERCLCITLPLRVKQIITPRRTTITIVAIYLLIILSYEPEYQRSYLGWKFDPITNTSYLGLLFRSNTESLAGVAFLLYAILGFASFIFVVILTLVLVIQLNNKSKWRSKSNSVKSQNEQMTNRDKKTVTMVVMIATVLIVCYTPGVAVSMVSFFEAEFTLFGRYYDIYLSCWSFVFIFESFNSSVNILLYYFMSTKYRETFISTFAVTIFKSKTSAPSDSI